MPVKGYDKYPIEQYVGTQFGEWTVLKFSHIDTGAKVYWWCRCSCGDERYVSRVDLLKGRTTKCRNCAGTKHDNTGVVRGHFMTKIYHNASSRSMILEVTQDYLNSIWTGTCALTGEPIYIGRRGIDETTASLDRIDSSRGYVYDNVQWVHKRINALKNDFDEAEFIKLCRQVADYSRGET